MAILDSTIIKGDLKVLGKIKEHGNSGVNFSTAEQIYGTWVDGKTVYQKSYLLDVNIASGSSFQSYSSGQAGYITPIDISGLNAQYAWFDMSHSVQIGDRYVLNMYVCDSTFGDWWNGWIDIQTKKLNLRGKACQNITQFIFTIYYIKN